MSLNVSDFQSDNLGGIKELQESLHGISLYKVYVRIQEVLTNHCHSLIFGNKYIF